MDRKHTSYGVLVASSSRSHHAHEDTAGRAYGFINNTETYAYAMMLVKSETLRQISKTMLDKTQLKGRLHSIWLSLLANPP